MIRLFRLFPLNNKTKQKQKNVVHTARFSTLRALALHSWATSISHAALTNYNSPIHKRKSQHTSTSNRVSFVTHTAHCHCVHNLSFSPKSQVQMVLNFGCVCYLPMSVGQVHIRYKSSRSCTPLFKFSCFKHLSLELCL